MCNMYNRRAGSAVGNEHRAVKKKAEAFPAGNASIFYPSSPPAAELPHPGEAFWSDAARTSLPPGKPFGRMPHGRAFPSVGKVAAKPTDEGSCRVCLRANISHAAGIYRMAKPYIAMRLAALFRCPAGAISHKRKRKEMTVKSEELSVIS